MAHATQNLLKGLTLLFWSLILTALTGVLGAAPLKLVRDYCGRVGYWLLGLLFVGLVFLTPWKALALCFLLILVAMGLFNDFEERGHGVLYSGSFAVLVTTLLGSGAFALWIYRTGTDWYSMLLKSVEQLLEPARQVASIQVEPATILAQAPSAFVILLTLAVFAGVIFENRLRLAFDLPKSASRHLGQFRLPDAFIWLLIVSVFFAFAKLGTIPTWIPILASNVLNVLALLFFFQGLAVVTKTLHVLRVGLFWQFLFFILIVFQLFLFVSVLGLFDYWIDFRSLLTRKATEWKNKENV